MRSIARSIIFGCLLAALALSQDLEINIGQAADGPLMPVKLTPVQPEGKAPGRAAVYSTGDTPPVLTDFYWGNQGTCSAATNPSGTITLFHPGAAGVGFNWCMLAKPLPAAPYTVVMGIRGHIFDRAQSLAVHLFDVITGKFMAYSMPGLSDAGTAAAAAWKMTNYTTYTAPPVFSYANSMVPSTAEYIRIRDNGTTRTIATSRDKEVWLTISAVPSTDWITPNFFGYALRGTGNGVASMLTIYHEAVTTP